MGGRLGIPEGALDLRGNKRRSYKASTMPQIILEDFNLDAAERRLCVEALTLAGNIVGAAQLLGVTRHALKRRIIKFRIEWPRSRAPLAESSASPLG